MTLNNLDIEMKISVEQIGVFFELIPVAICITEPENGKYVYVNQKFETLFKVKRNQILNKKSTSLGIITIENRKIITETIAKKGNIDSKKIVLSTFDGQNLNMIIAIQKIIIAN